MKSFSLHRVVLFVFLEVVAVFLAFIQYLQGLETDEAKYLLNIPYPHPPLVRWILHMTEWLPEQELFWRIMFGSLLVQAVWIVWTMVRPVSQRIVLCALWLFSASLLLQAGSIMMAPLTALSGVVFVWLWQRPVPCRILFVHVLWLLSLFTAYQAVLYFPIVYAIFRRQKLPIVWSLLYTGVPMFFVVLYVAGNPLAFASFVHAGGQNVAEPFVRVLQHILWSWMFAGSCVLSILGVLGMIRSRSWILVLSFILVCLFHYTSFRSYYAILFLPLLIGGVATYPKLLHKGSLILAAHIVCTLWMIAQNAPMIGEFPARTVMQVVHLLPQDGPVLIEGSFGHQWQYESTSPILRYRPHLLPIAKAVVCLEQCPDLQEFGFFKVETLSEQVWVRR